MKLITIKQLCQHIQIYIYAFNGYYIKEIIPRKSKVINMIFLIDFNITTNNFFSFYMDVI